MLEFLLYRPVTVEVLEYNAAAIPAAQNGYGPRLRHLHRTKRIHLSYLGEVFDKENPQAEILKVETKLQKGDILTKEMERARFEECKAMLQIVPATCALTARARTLICINGQLLPPAVALAALNSKDETPKTILAVSKYNAFIVDSGSGHHLVGRRQVDETKLTKVDPDSSSPSDGERDYIFRFQNKNLFQRVENLRRRLGTGRHAPGAFRWKARC